MKKLYKESPRCDVRRSFIEGNFMLSNGATGEKVTPVDGTGLEWTDIDD